VDALGRPVEALRPESLEDAHLPDAIADMARRWAEASACATAPPPSERPTSGVC
jgi:hypothetical protein